MTVFSLFPDFHCILVKTRLKMCRTGAFRRSCYSVGRLYTDGPAEKKLSWWRKDKEEKEEKLAAWDYSSPQPPTPPALGHLTDTADKPSVFWVLLVLWSRMRKETNVLSVCVCMSDRKGGQNNKRLKVLHGSRLAVNFKKAHFNYSICCNGWTKPPLEPWLPIRILLELVFGSHGNRGPQQD